MDIYTAYKNAKDREKKFSVRRFEVLPKEKKIVPREIIIESDDYLEIFEWLESNCLTMLERFTEDDPVILETWI